MSAMVENEEVHREVYRAGEYIFFEGDMDYHFYIIESGQVSIFTKSPEGKRLPIATLSEGESFGEFALLDRKPRSASAIADIETVVFQISEKGYEQLLGELPVWASSMLRSFSNRLRNMNNVLQQLGINRP